MDKRAFERFIADVEAVSKFHAARSEIFELMARARANIAEGKDLIHQAQLFDAESPERGGALSQEAALNLPEDP